MIVTVEAKGPFGVLAAEDKKWKSFKDKKMLSTMAVGQQYDMKLEKVKCEDGKVREQVTAIAPSGGNSNVGQETQVVAPAKKAFIAKEKRSFGEGEKTDWAAKDRSQLVGGRSHDAVELVSVSLHTATPLPEVLAMYREALVGVLEIAKEVK